MVEAYLCPMCKQECYRWEISGCAKCQHIIAIKSIRRLEDTLKEIFAKKGINYEQYKRSIQGDLSI